MTGRFDGISPDEKLHAAALLKQRHDVAAGSIPERIGGPSTWCSTRHRSRRPKKPSRTLTTSCADRRGCASDDRPDGPISQPLTLRRPRDGRASAGNPDDYDVMSDRPIGRARRHVRRASRERRDRTNYSAQASRRLSD
jgi:hypothetical protein